MKKDRAEFAARLRNALRAADIEASASVLEKLLARHGGPPVTAQAISGWLSGRYLPRQDKIRVLAEIVGMDPYELQYGGAGTRRVKESRVDWPEGIGAQDRQAIETLLALPPAKRRLVRELVQALTEPTKAR